MSSRNGAATTLVATVVVILAVALALSRGSRDGDAPGGIGAAGRSTTTAEDHELGDTTVLEELVDSTESNSSARASSDGPPSEGTEGAATAAPDEPQLPDALDDASFEALYGHMDRMSLLKEYKQISTNLPREHFRSLHKSKVSVGDFVVIGKVERLEDGRLSMPSNQKNSKEGLPLQFMLHATEDGKAVETTLSDAEMAPFAAEYAHLRWLKTRMSSRR